MTDISALVPKNKQYGNYTITYTSFGEPREKPERIGFFFVRDIGAINFVNFGILPNLFNDKIYLSDDRAVVADMDIPLNLENNY
jgi:hypothetical protein